MLPFIWILKLAIFFSRVTGLGAGSTWPGHIILGMKPSFLKDFDKNFRGKIIVIAGTNGKTTTSKIIRSILEKSGKIVTHNESGANLLNGVASAVISGTSWKGSLADGAIFEIDENSLPLLLNELTPDILVILNLFRDQLDRYGEVNAIALKWEKAIGTLPKSTMVILNANDPEIAFLGKNLKSIKYFGISNKMLYLAKRPHAMDAVSCPNCGGHLSFEGIYLGHLGNWQCISCKLKEPDIDFLKEYTVLPGLYNIYNTQAAILVAKTLGVDGKTIDSVLQNFTPAFGRQEEFVVTFPSRHPELDSGSSTRTVKIFLSKNPTGFNESLRTVRELDAKNILLVLNDRIPDGRDVSWIWDVDFEEFLDDTVKVKVTGDRAFDMALRLKYAHPTVKHVNTHPTLDKALPDIIEKLPEDEILFILPTYSAMLEVRKILTGRKIL